MINGLKEFKIMRIRKGVTQAELSQRLGLPQQSVSRWESGKCKPSISIVRRLANVLEVDVEELIACFE